MLHVTGPTRGGIRAHVALLRRHLPTRGYRVCLAAPKPLKPGETASWTLLPLTDRAASALSPRTALALARAVKEFRPALLHAHGYKAALAARLAGLAGPRIPRVVTLHNPWPPAPGPPQRAALAWAARGATLVAVSDAIAKEVRRAMPEATLAVIGNGVEVERFLAIDRDAARVALGLPCEAPIVAFVGRLTREKGADLALEALARLRAWGVPARLLVAGDGPLHAELLALADRLGLSVTCSPGVTGGEGEVGASVPGGEPALYLLGERSDVERLLAAADAVLIPSRSEGQSVVALEAMAASRPIVAAGVGGLGPLVEAGGGLVVPPDAPDALAAALAHLLADPDDLSRRGARGRAYVVRYASAAAIADATAALYARVLGTGPC